MLMIVFVWRCWLFLPMSSDFGVTPSKSVVVRPATFAYATGTSVKFRLTSKALRFVRPTEQDLIHR